MNVFANINNILTVIPARGGSKGIPKKNIRELGGKPLIEYTAEAALQSEMLSRVVLSTEDENIKNIGVKLGLEAPFTRPNELALDNTPTIPVIQHAVRFMEENEHYQPKFIVILQPTSPLRTKTHINQALDIFIKSDANSLVSVTEVPHNMIPNSVMQMKYNGRLKEFIVNDQRNNIRQNKPEYYARNGAAIYICTYELLMKYNKLYDNDTVPFIMSKLESIDIDDEIDWIIAEQYLNYINHSINYST